MRIASAILWALAYIIVAITGLAAVISPMAISHHIGDPLRTFIKLMAMLLTGAIFGVGAYYANRKVQTHLKLFETLTCIVFVMIILFIPWFRMQ